MSNISTIAKIYPTASDEVAKILRFYEDNLSAHNKANTQDENLVNKAELNDSIKADLKSFDIKKEL